MGRTYCCVVDCKNTSLNSNYKFYKFPRSQWRTVQRQKWISAVNRQNSDGSPWKPRITDKICSSHFIGNEKSESNLSPSYIPTIFPAVYKKRTVDGTAALNRHKRFLKKRNREQQSTQTSENIVEIASVWLPEHTSHTMDLEQCKIGRVDHECQVNIFNECSFSENSFTCNRYIFQKSKFCEAEVQTDIMDINALCIKTENNDCASPIETYDDIKIEMIDFKDE